MALQMTDKAAMETLRARLSLALPPERLRDILPDSPNAPLMGLPQFSELFPDVKAAPVVEAARSPLDPLPRPGLAGASNAFAAMGRRTAGGAPLLATDPHLGLSAPSIWMLARMDLAEGPVMGGDDPGDPGGDRRAQRRPRLGADLELPRRPGRLYREAEPGRTRRST